MNKYQENKEKVRQKAIEWQADFEKQDYCWGECHIYQQYFEDKARRYGLIKEFRENGII